MPTTPIVQARPLESVLQSQFNPVYNIDVMNVTVHTGGIAAGSNLLGGLVWFTGGVWKNMIAADVVTATDKVGVILKRDVFVQAVTAGTVIKLPILMRGPACVHKSGLNYTAHVQATIDAALLLAGIKVVTETGAAYLPTP